MLIDQLRHGAFHGDDVIALWGVSSQVVSQRPASILLARPPTVIIERTRDNSSATFTRAYQANHGLEVTACRRRELGIKQGLDVEYTALVALDQQAGLALDSCK